MVFSSSAVYAMEKFNDSYYFLKRQAVWCLLGTAALFITKNLDYHKLHQHTYLIMVTTFLLLLAVMFPEVSKEVGGARRWLTLGGLSFQPSELAKFALVLYIAKSLVKRADKLKDFAYGYLPNLIVLGLFFIPILFQPDFGTTMIICMVTFTMIYRRPEKEVLVFFRARADSFHCIGGHERGIPHPENHRLSRPMAGPFGRRVSSHPVFLRFWSGRLLGNRFRSQPSKTILSSRSPHRFHFFRHWGRTRIYGDYSHHTFIFDFNLAGFRHCISGQRFIWNSFGNWPDSYDRISSFYKSGSSRRDSSN